MRHSVKAQQVARETARDKTLSKELTLTQQGWNSDECSDPKRRGERFVEQNKAVWCGEWELSSHRIWEPVPKELHWSHPRTARTKSMALSQVWWPKLDADLKKTAWQCSFYIKIRNASLAAPLFPWTWPSGPWKRIHIGFATHEEKHYLVMVVSYSTWPEAILIGPMRSTNATATIRAFSNPFIRYRLASLSSS